MNYGIQVFRLEGPGLRVKEFRPQDMKQDFFKRLAGFAVAVDRRQQKRRANKHHEQDGNIVSEKTVREPVKRQPCRPGEAKADKLPFCEVEQDFRMDAAQVFVDGDVAQKILLSIEKGDNKSAYPHGQTLVSI